MAYHFAVQKERVMLNILNYIRPTGSNYEFKRAHKIWKLSWSSGSRYLWEKVSYYNILQDVKAFDHVKHERLTLKDEIPAYLLAAIDFSQGCNTNNISNTDNENLKNQISYSNIYHLKTKK